MSISKHLYFEIFLIFLLFDHTTGYDFPDFRVSQGPKTCSAAFDMNVVLIKKVQCPDVISHPGPNLISSMAFFLVYHLVFLLTSFFKSFCLYRLFLFSLSLFIPIAAKENRCYFSTEK